MAEPLPMVLVPGLLTSPRLYAEQLPSLWRLGPVTIAGNTRDDAMAAIASRSLRSPIRDRSCYSRWEPKPRSNSK